jgi:hypothetical protein
MNIRLLLRSLPASLFILRCAAWLVPVAERAEWLAEWQAELWHVWHTYRRRPRRGHDATDFCLGAFQDAFWLRWNNPQSIPRRILRAGSASRCSFCLAIWAGASLCMCLFLPGAHRAIWPSLYPDANSLVMISSGGYAGAQSPTIRFRDYQSWKTSTHHLFTGVAFYQAILKRVHVTRHPGTELSIGRASDNLFDLLKVSVSPDTAPRSEGRDTARLFLSEAAWHSRFGSDPHMLGSFTDIAGQRVVIAGIVAQDSWPLPGQVDAWLLEDEQHLEKLGPNSRGFVLAHVRSTKSQARADGWRYMTVPREEGNDRFDCISLAQRARLPFSIFLFTLIVALITLPATTALPLGEYPRHSGRLAWTVRARRWIFLSTKAALVVSLVYFSSVGFAYGFHSLSSTAAQSIQLATSFLGFLLGFRWILQDQRKRCPVCLRALSNPARVGQASRNFLAWNGTELICAGGHGLLHIPEIPTSWFSTQRWLDLDASWGSLFTDAYIPSAGLI